MEIICRITSWEREGENGEMVQRFRSIIDGNKINRGKFRIA